MRRGVWSEFVPYATLREEATRRLLQRYRLDLQLAVTPDTLGELSETVAALRRDSIAVSLWPMLPRAEGRWPNAHNVDRWRALVDEVAEMDVQGLAIDLEPPYDQLDGMLHLRPWAFVPRRRSERGAAGTAFREEARRWRDRGRDVMVVTMPLVLDDARGGWQQLLGIPVDALALERVSVMLYTSLLEGYSRGLLRRADVRGLLAAWARRARARFRHPSVSLGCVGRGILGDEPVLRDPSELADDVAIARGAGVDDLLLFSLGGVLARHPEGWLDAFTEPLAKEEPRITPRARVVLAACRLGGDLGAWATRSPGEGPPRR